jgi:hypothetical protein
MVNIDNTTEGKNGPAQAALFSRHPEMTEWAGMGGHDFQFFK